MPINIVFLTEAEAAHYLEVPPDQLRQWTREWNEPRKILLPVARKPNPLSATGADTDTDTDTGDGDGDGDFSWAQLYAKNELDEFFDSSIFEDYLIRTYGPHKRRRAHDYNPDRRSVTTSKVFVSVEDAWRQDVLDVMRGLDPDAAGDELPTSKIIQTLRLDKSKEWAKPTINLTAADIVGAVLADLHKSGDIIYTETSNTDSGGRARPGRPRKTVRFATTPADATSATAATVLTGASE